MMTPLIAGYGPGHVATTPLAGDLEAARRVELVLPAGGACTVPATNPAGSTGDAHCAAPEPAAASAVAPVSWRSAASVLSNR